jgi:DNA-binding protein YbaB
MFGNISKMLEMKKKAEEMKAKIGQLVLTKQLLGVSVTLEGMQKVAAIKFEDDFLVNKSKQEVEEILVMVINAAQEELQAKLKEEFSDLTGGLGL